MPLYVQEVLLAPASNGRNLVAPVGGATVGLDLGASALQFTELQLIRGAADVLEQRRGANAQTLRVYGTYTDASNYSCLQIAGGLFQTVISQERAGTGAQSNLFLLTGTGNTGAVVLGTTNTARWEVCGTNGGTAAGHLIPAVAGYDIGGTGSYGTFYPRTVYAATSLQQIGANAQSLSIQSLTELTTIAAAATTDTVIQIPAGAISVGVSVRVTTAIPTAATFTYGVAGATARYGTGISTAANTTYPGTDDGLRFYASAVSIRFTPNATPAAATGVVRTTIHYLSVVPPTS